MCGFELEMNTKNGIDNGVDDGVCGCVACDVHDTIRVVVFTTYYLYVVLYILVSLMIFIVWRMEKWFRQLCIAKTKICIACDDGTCTFQCRTTRHEELSPCDHNKDNLYSAAYTFGVFLHSVGKYERGF